MSLKYCFTATLSMLCKVLGVTFLFQVSKFHAYIWPSILIGIPFLPIWASFSFFRSQTISCSSLLNFSRKTCRGLWDNFGFFLSYSTNFTWASNTAFIVAFMLHAGFLNNSIFSSRICLSLQFPFLKSNINMVDFYGLFSPTALLKIIVLWFPLQHSSLTDPSRTRSFASLRAKISNIIFFYEL